jgi:hypothetical protein
MSAITGHQLLAPPGTIRAKVFLMARRVLSHGVGDIGSAVLSRLVVFAGIRWLVPPRQIRAKRG